MSHTVYVTKEKLLSVTPTLVQKNIPFNVVSYGPGDVEMVVTLAPDAKAEFDALIKEPASSTEKESDAEAENEGVTKLVKCHIENDEGAILLIRRAQSDTHGGFWESAGGGVDDGESCDEACVREVHEECGLNVEVEYQDSITLTDDEDPSLKFNVNLYVATSIKNQVNLNHNEDHDAFTWVKKSDIGNFIKEGNQIDRWTLTHMAML